MKKTLIITVFTLLSVLMLTSCGKKGDLVRPVAMEPEVHIVKSATLTRQ